MSPIVSFKAKLLVVVDGVLRGLIAEEDPAALGDEEEGDGEGHAQAQGMALAGPQRLGPLVRSQPLVLVAFGSSSTTVLMLLLVPLSLFFFFLSLLALFSLASVEARRVVRG